jgi:hypothetical protein
MEEAVAGTYFRRGLGLKKEVAPVLDAEYHSAVVAQIKARATRPRSATSP